jgi:hypothetical protein
MRLVLVALLAALGCSRTPTAATPANKAPTPDYQQSATDELAFLASDADFVLGFDLKELRGSQIWKTFGPQIDAFMKKAQEEFGGTCNDDFMQKLERITVALKVPGGNKVSGVAVLHGGDMPGALKCSASIAGKSGKTATMDRDVLVLTNAAKPELGSASRAITPSTLVVHLDKGASYDSLGLVLASGVPLRTSPAFMKLYERRERGASMWGMANGNASVFDQMASSGMRPRSIDGTIVASDRLVINVRMTMAGAAEATNIAAEIDKMKGFAASYVERVDVRTEGELAHIQVALTEAQLRNLAGMLGAMAGP